MREKSSTMSVMLAMHNGQFPLLIAKKNIT